jgi:Zn-dependent M16 (insulinase) family peptidase
MNGLFSIHTRKQNRWDSPTVLEHIPVLDGLRIITVIGVVLYQMIKEVMLHSKWNEVDKIREIVLQCKQALQEDLILNGHIYAMKRVGAEFTAEAIVKEQVSGYSWHQWIQGLVENYDTMVEKIQSMAKGVVYNTVCQKRMTVSITAATLPDKITDLIQCFKEGCATNEYYVTLGNEKKSYQKEKIEGILIPSKVSYSALGANIGCLKISYYAATRVKSSFF